MREVQAEDESSSRSVEKQVTHHPHDHEPADNPPHPRAQRSEKMKDCECPYCNADVEITNDDGFHEDRIYEQECPKCEKTFVFTASYSIHYSAYRADCLNGGEHRYKETCAYPKEYRKLRCEDCGHEKPLETAPTHREDR